MLREDSGFFGELISEADAGDIALPDDVEEAMADLALVFGWGPRDLDAIDSLADLARWRERARARWNPEKRDR